MSLSVVWRVWLRVPATGFLRTAGILTLLSVIAAAGPSPADFPLRVHMFQVSQHSHYRRGSLDYVDGEGRANLFENSNPQGFDFGYRCGRRLLVSPGYETYPARWKKSGRQIDILLPVMGKPGEMSACNLQVEMKDTVYFRHNGILGEESEATLKDWMQKHEYDPEHGKNLPIMPPAPPQPNDP